MAAITESGSNNWFSSRQLSVDAARQYLQSSPVIINFSASEWRARFLKTLVSYGLLFMGMGMLSALIKLTSLRAEGLQSQIPDRAITLIKAVQIVIDGAALFLVPFIREVVPYSLYSHVYQAGFVYFLATQTIVETVRFFVTRPGLQLVYYVIFCKPLVNVLLFVYLGDIMQKYVRDASILEVLLQGVVISGFAGTTKFYNNEITRLCGGFSIYLFSAGMILLNGILYAMDWLNSDDQVLNSFKPKPTEFNTRALVDVRLLRKALTTPLIIFVFATIFCFTFLLQYYERVKTVQLETIRRLSDSIVITPAPLQRPAIYNPVGLLPTAMSTLRAWRESVVRRVLFINDRLNPLYARTLMSMPQVMDGALFEGTRSNPLWRGRLSQLIMSCNIFKNSGGNLSDTELAQYNAVARELIYTQVLQILLFGVLMLTQVVPRYQKQISAMTFISVPVAALINALWQTRQGVDFIQLHHALQSIDMALKKPTKDYAYTTMTYESKTYVRMISQILCEPVAKLLATSTGHMVIAYSIRPAMKVPFLMPVTMATIAVYLTILLYWVTAGSALTATVYAENKANTVIDLFNNDVQHTSNAHNEDHSTSDIVSTIQK